MTGYRDVDFRLRATRAAPPGLASRPTRRGTFGASLAQFDELMAAAAATTPASRPIPLFYALSQAGRAVAAAHAPQRWRLRMHGLSCPELDGPLLSVPVVRARARRTGPEEVDSFSGVADATGSLLPSKRVELGALWTSLPELIETVTDGQRADWPTPLLLVPDVPDAPLVPLGRVDAVLVGFSGHPDHLEAHLRAAFPSAAGIRLHRPQGLPHVLQHTDSGQGIRVNLDAETPDVAGHLRALDYAAPGGEGFVPRWIRPGVGGAAVSPFMTWWAFLFGLSMLARYEPEGWTAAACARQFAFGSAPRPSPFDRRRTCAGACLRSP
jgi:hypothetical protein